MNEKITYTLEDVLSYIDIYLIEKQSIDDEDESNKKEENSNKQTNEKNYGQMLSSMERMRQADREELDKLRKQADKMSKRRHREKILSAAKTAAIIGAGAYGLNKYADAKQSKVKRDINDEINLNNNKINRAKKKVENVKEKMRKRKSINQYDHDRRKAKFQAINKKKNARVKLLNKKNDKLRKDLNEISNDKWKSVFYGSDALQDFAMGMTARTGIDKAIGLAKRGKKKVLKAATDKLG